jgi:hypothetical protein
MAELCGFREVAASHSKMIGHSDLIKWAGSCGFPANHFRGIRVRGPSQLWQRSNALQRRLPKQRTHNIYGL